MGFGRGKGFTLKCKAHKPTYVTKGGGGKSTKTHTMLNPTYTTAVS